MSTAHDLIRFVKYQALGNDYLFLDAGVFARPGVARIRKICHRNFGIGSDGILYGGPLVAGDFFVEIINPDGSSAEVSGNGMRIFARAMFDLGRVPVGGNFFTKTHGVDIKCTILSADRVAVDMGVPLFRDSNIPNFTGDVLTISVNGRAYECFPVSIGNPHCVIFVDTLSSDEVEESGKILEKNENFPNGTNAEFVKIIDKGNIAVDTWERGAGHTLACGSGACAAFAVARKLGMCAPAASIHMAGGSLDVMASESGAITQCGPVERIAECSTTVDSMC
jgi:diaminopimelate epimerase